MKLMFEFDGSEEEYLALMNLKTTECGGFIFSHKQFDVSQDIFFDLAYNLDRKVIAGRAFINSEQEIELQTKQVEDKLTKIFNRRIRNLHYSPAPTWEGSLDHQRYVKREGIESIR